MLLNLENLSMLMGTDKTQEASTLTPERTINN